MARQIPSRHLFDKILTPNQIFPQRVGIRRTGEAPAHPDHGDRLPAFATERAVHRCQQRFREAIFFGNGHDDLADILAPAHTGIGVGHLLE